MKNVQRNLLILFLIILLLFFYLDYGNSKLYNKEDKKGRTYWHGSETEKNIALTFDDGPSDCTPEILNILKSMRINATFFIVGINAERLPSLLKREFHEGHEIGSHSYSHPDMQIEAQRQIDKQFDETESVINGTIGLNVSLFRPPYGADNPFVLKEAVRRGYTIIKWSLSGRDWETDDPKRVADRIIKDIRNGSIILLHDGRMGRPEGILVHYNLTKTDTESVCRSTISSLPIIIENLTAEGYKFVTVSELLNLKK